MTLKQYLLRLVPVSILLSALQIRPMVSVQILKDTVLVLQSTKVGSLRGRGCVLNCGESSSLL
jgi:hypothetical protein